MDERPRYDTKLAHILRKSAAVFAKKGYHSASIRDIASATGVSLSGLYYYFDSKEELLYLIQNHCFGTLIERLESELEEASDPEERLQLLVRNHLRFFLSNMDEMKVLSHEADVLTGSYLRDTLVLKRRYVEIASSILEELRSGSDGPDVRLATFSLFGMLNWIYTWYRPERDPGADELAAEILHLFLHGFRSGTVAPSGGAEAGGAEEESPSIWRDS